MEEPTFMQRLTLRVKYKFKGGNPRVPAEMEDLEELAFYSLLKYGSKRKMPIALRLVLFGYLSKHEEIITELKSDFLSERDTLKKAEIIMEILDKEYKYNKKKKRKGEFNSAVFFEKFFKDYDFMIDPSYELFCDEIHNHFMQLFKEKYAEPK